MPKTKPMTKITKDKMEEKIERGIALVIADNSKTIFVVHELLTLFQQEKDEALKAQREELLDDTIHLIKEAREGYNTMIGMLSSGLYYKSQFKKECQHWVSFLTKKLNKLSPSKKGEGE